jgi:high-affinity K+ transport system ATPase subunit B
VTDVILVATIVAFFVAGALLVRVLDRMIALVEGASRQKTPNEIALDILIAGLTLVLLVAVVTLL